MKHVLADPDIKYVRLSVSEPLVHFADPTKRITIEVDGAINRWQVGDTFTFRDTTYEARECTWTGGTWRIEGREADR